MSKEGEQDLRKFASANKKASRVNPKKYYRLKSSIYGPPGANHEWDMLLQSAHIETCGLTLFEVEPSPCILQMSLCCRLAHLQDMDKRFEIFW